MASRTFRVSVPDELDFAFAFITERLNSAGLTIQNPYTGKITSWSEEGDQVVTATEDVLTEIKSAKLTNVQFWASSSDDLFVSWNWDGHLSIFSFHLNGLEVSRTIAIASNLIEGLLIKYASNKLSGDVFVVNFE
ncbi:hypothetical protein [Paraburkholderia bannensis]|uniref:hypothetical protein n=1 Tax=Paraburkholderia bannensis TaxID=765414 RepID=UPI002AB034D5|nr:hypothetical protein [Paraburkholderia bannensis]